MMKAAQAHVLMAGGWSQKGSHDEGCTGTCADGWWVESEGIS